MLGNGKGPGFTDRAAVPFKSPHHQASDKRQTDTSSCLVQSEGKCMHLSHHLYNESLESELKRGLGFFLESRRNAKQTCQFLMQFNSTAVSHFTV